MEKTSVLVQDAKGNSFGKVSRLSLTAAAGEGRTILKDVYFTAPYKIMHPFPNADGSIQVMLLSASAGIMAGDRQEFDLNIEEGASMEFVSQSYEKIHQMAEGHARRQVHVHVARNASFCFHPQPTIPFAGSAFENRMRIDLEDETSEFRMCEIFSCGRSARREYFAYRFYHSLTEIYRSGTIIYRDNTRYDPSVFDMSEMGMYESHTHLASLFLTRPEEPSRALDQIRTYLEEQEDVEGAATMLAQGDLAVRILGGRAQRLEELSSHILCLGSQV